MDKIPEGQEDAARQYNNETSFWYAEASFGGLARRRGSCPPTNWRIKYYIDHAP